MDNKLPAQYKKAFKDADIRGISVTEIDDDLAYQVARAFVDQFKYKTVLIGYDMRISTPSLVEAFERGVLDAGADAVNLGLVHSPMLYYASGTMQLPGVMITASHSPANYNGLKLVEPDAIPLTKVTGLDAILKRIENQSFQTPKKRGRRKAKDVRKGYTKFIAKNCTVSRNKIRIAADAGNGMGGILYPLLTKSLGLKTHMLFGDLDGRFPNRGSDPTIRSHQKHLIKELKRTPYDFGIAFDGDADRIAFLDEKGSFVNCAAIGALVTKKLIEKNPDASFVYTNLTSRVYKETIKEVGGKVIRARVGHAFIKRKMREKGAVFGCEHSGHFYYKDFFYTDSIMVTLCYVLEAYEAARKAGVTFSEMMKPYVSYTQLEDTLVDVTDKKIALAKMEQYIDTKYKTATVTRFDGLFLDLGEVWGAVKPSVTEHALKIMFESKSKKRATEVQTDLVGFATEIALRTK